MLSFNSASSQTQEYDYLFKYVIVGNARTGKSSLLLRYADNTFTSEYKSTIGVDFKAKHTEVESKKVKLQIWDTAGQERFRTITSSYYRGALAVLLAVGFQKFNESGEPVSESKEDFIKRAKQEIDLWLGEIERYGTENTAVFLAVGQADLIPEKDKASIREELLNYARQKKIQEKIFLVSAKTGEGVDNLFSETSTFLVQSLKASVQDEPTEEFVASKQLQGTKRSHNPILGFINGILGTIVGSVVTCLAMTVMYNPLSIIYTNVSKTNWWLLPLIMVFSPIISAAVSSFGLGIGAYNGWSNGLTGIFPQLKADIFENEESRKNFKHMLASWLVLIFSAAVVLSVIFPPAGLALWLPTLTATVGLSGVSTAVLAVIAGAAAALFGSIAYGLSNLILSGKPSKNPYAEFSEIEEFDAAERPVTGAKREENPLAQAALGDKNDYKQVFKGEAFEPSAADGARSAAGYGYS